jgi:hypothetical protein
MTGLKIPGKKSFHGIYLHIIRPWHEIHPLISLRTARLPLTGFFVHPTLLRACRTWGIESEKAAERGQILTISPAERSSTI